MPEEIKELTQTTQKELGGHNLMFAVAFDTAGNKTVFRGSQIKTSEVGFPDTTAIPGVSRIDVMSVVTATPNSPICCLVTSGGKTTRFCWGS